MRSIDLNLERSRHNFATAMHSAQERHENLYVRLLTCMSAFTGSPSFTGLFSPLSPMARTVDAHVLCSSLSLVCILAQSCLLVRSALRLERAERGDEKKLSLLRPPTWLRRTKQISPLVTAVSGLLYCTCDIVLRMQGGQHAVSRSRDNQTPPTMLGLGIHHPHHSVMCSTSWGNHHSCRTGFRRLADRQSMGNACWFVRCLGCWHYLHPAAGPGTSFHREWTPSMLCFTVVADLYSSYWSHWLLGCHQRSHPSLKWLLR